jgi:hypothetical protein
VQNLIGEKLQERNKTYLWLSLETGLGLSHVRHAAKDKKNIPSLLTADKIARALNSRIGEVWKLESSPTKTKKAG